MNKICAFASLLLFLIPPVIAHDDETLFNTVNLQAQAEREIPNDQMIVLLATEHEGSDTAGLAAKINSDMQWALEQIKKYSNIESQTKSYQTYLNHNLIEAFLLGAAAHINVEGEWNNDLMKQVKAPGAIQ